MKGGSEPRTVAYKPLPMPTTPPENVGLGIHFLAYIFFDM
jgi:hypothetical protein